MYRRGLTTGRSSGPIKRSLCGAAVLALVVFSACGGVGEPDDPVRGDPVGNTGNQSGNGTDVTTDPNANPDPPQLNADSPPPTTCKERIGLVGMAPPNTTVIASSGGQASVGANGRFCLPVTLIRGQDNQIQIRVVDQEQRLSETVTRTVQQTGEPCPQLTDTTASTSTLPPQEENVAHNQSVVVSPNAQVEGSQLALVDGNLSTQATVESGWTTINAPIWVAVNLRQSYPLQRIMVHFGGGSGWLEENYAQRYRVLVSQQGDNAGEPNLSGAGGWHEIFQVPNGRGGVDEITLGEQNPKAAQHVALWLEADNSRINPWESYAIAELEVFAMPQQNRLPAANAATDDVCLGEAL